MISRRLRYEVLRRDGHRCRYCGATGDEERLTVDHVVPTALGGADEPSNLVTACQPCNVGKSSSSPDQPIVEDVAEDALRWSRAMAQAADWQAGQRAQRDEYGGRFEEAWHIWKWGEAEVIAEYPNDWEATLGRFYDAGLEFEVIERAIDLAMTRVQRDRVFRYFCGVCWNTITERQKIARSLLEQDDT